MNISLRSIQDCPEVACKVDWSVAELAKYCGVSTRSLQRHFRQAYNQSPEAWLADQRWQQALKLLREGNSVKITASKLGYCHPSTFSREFKKRFGQSPAFFMDMPDSQPDLSHDVA